jgi:hypothetical protein
MRLLRSKFTRVVYQELELHVPSPKTVRNTSVELMPVAFEMDALKSFTTGLYCSAANAASRLTVVPKLKLRQNWSTAGASLRYTLLGMGEVLKEGVASLRYTLLGMGEVLKEGVAVPGTSASAAKPLGLVVSARRPFGSAFTVAVARGKSAPDAAAMREVASLALAAETERDMVTETMEV